MIRKTAVLAAIAALGLAAAANAAPNGTYTGKSTLHFSGATATHPFALTVNNGKVTRVALFAGATCTDLNLEAGLGLKTKIKHRKFKVSIHAGHSVVKLSGKFSGKHVSGAFSGTAHVGTAACSIPKNTYSATK